MRKKKFIDDGKGVVIRDSKGRVKKLKGKDKKKKSSLRSKAIRLAYDNPDLRPHLLPLLDP